MYVGGPLSGVMKVHSTSIGLSTPHFEDLVFKAHVQLQVKSARKISAVAMIIYENFRDGCECVTSGRVVNSSITAIELSIPDAK